MPEVVADKVKRAFFQEHRGRKGHGEKGEGVDLTKSYIVKKKRCGKCGSLIRGKAPDLT